MITSVCMNPSFDRTVELEQLAMGQVNRVKPISLDMGGKGINVAVVAHRLGLESKVVGCMAEDGAAQLYAMLRNEEIQSSFMSVHGRIRTNLKLCIANDPSVTELNEPGDPLTEDDLKKFESFLQAESKNATTVVMTGSLPPGCPAGTYRNLMRSLEGRPCVLDATGDELLLGAEATPFLVKPNLHELQATLRLELRTLRSIRDACHIFLSKGVQHMVVSMGVMGAVYVDHQTTLFAPALRVDVKSTVGAGDAMLGGILKGLEEEGDMKQAFRYGVAAGAASVMTEGTKLIRPRDFYCLLDQVKVQEV